MKTFEEIKQCLIAICNDYPELETFIEGITTTTIDEKLDEIRLKMSGIQSKHKSDIARKINLCSNTYSKTE